MEKYQKNLKIDNNKVYSYNTHVATIDRDNNKLYVHGYWSMTTSKHINYVANSYGLSIEKKEISAAENENQKLSMLKTVSMIAKLGDIFHADKAGGNQKARNDWKTRMLKAGLEGRGLIMPDDWDKLTEDLKEIRLNGVIEQLKTIK